MEPITDPKEIASLWETKYQWIDREAKVHTSTFKSDWGEAAEYANWNPEDVEAVIAMDEGENDCSNWLMVVKLKDGRFSFLSAGCDYTGWDCRAGGNSDEKDSLLELIRLGMGREDRDRLGIPQPITEQA